MRRIIIGLLLLLAVAGVTAGGWAIAQDDEKSRFVRFVERQISTPDRRISLGTIDGALSSDVRISEITIADRRGVWLRIENAELVWSRLALLRGRLDIDSLSADAIIISRPPLPAETDEPLDDEPFTLPDLPVEVDIDALNVARVSIAEGLVGPAASLSVQGRVRLVSGSLDTALTIERLDRPGSLSLEVVLEEDSRRLNVDVKLSEPEGGVLANALQIEGRPALALEIAGDAPLSDFVATLTLDADGQRVLSGQTEVAAADDGSRFTANLSGDLTPLVADLYKPFVEGGSTLDILLDRAQSGAITIQRAALKSGAADLTITGSFAPDGVPTLLSVDGMLGRADGEALVLPGSGGGSTLGSATIFGSLGADGAIEGRVEVVDLDASFIGAPAALIELEGQADNLGTAQSRAVRFSVRGGADNITSGRGAIADALGRRLRLTAQGNWRTGAPLTLDTAAFETATVSASFQGTVEDGVSGRYALRADDLSAFAALAGRDLAGSITLSAIGSIGFDGLADLMLDGTAQDLALGLGNPDALLAGATRLSGRAARTADGVSFDSFSVANDQVSLTANGGVSDTEADLTAALSLADLAALDPRLAGGLATNLNVSGDPSRPSVVVTLSSDEIDVNARPLTDLSGRFAGTVDRASGITGDVDGGLTLTGMFAGEPLSAALDIETREDERAIQNLVVRVADAVAQGGITWRSGLLDGQLLLNVPDLSRVAALGMIEAAGLLDADVRFTTSDEQQNASVNATARGVEVPGLSLGFAAIDMSVNDVFGIPALDGTAELRALEAGGVNARTLDLSASRDGDTNDISLSGDVNGSTVSANGSVERQESGFVATLRAFNLARQELTAQLVSPTRVTVGENIVIDTTTLDVGGGRVVVEGQIGEQLDARAEISALPLGLANVVVPELGLSGVIDGEVDVSGTRGLPELTARIAANDVTTADLRASGIGPLRAYLDAQFARGVLTLQRAEADVGAGSLRATGTAGDTFALTVNAQDLPLALANAFVPDLGLTGTLSGDAKVDGPRRAPDATFTLAARNVSAQATREFGVEPATADISGEFVNGAVTLSQAVINAGAAEVTVTGTAGRTLNLQVNARNLPLALANTFAPQAGVSGTASLDAQVTGRSNRPIVRFRATSPSFSAAGLGGGSFDIAGGVDGATVRLDTANATLGGGSVSARGTVGRTLDLTADLSSLPLAAANAFAPGQDLQGRLSGTVRVSGRPASPRAVFNIGVDGFSAAPVSQVGVGALAIRADGRFERNRIILSSLTAQGNGLSMSASGTVPLSGGGLNLSVDGRAPLLLANRVLAERAASVDGTATASVVVTGSLARPQVRGDVSASGIVFRDPQSNLVLQDGSLSASFTGDRVVLRQLTATLGGGTLSVTGSVGITGNFDADLTIALRDARYTDGRLAAVTLSGDLTVNGPLLASPLLAGQIDIARAEITVPATLGSVGALIDVRHINTPPGVLETLRRARVGPFAQSDEGGGSPDGGLRLDLQINAPARIFVRGRGIDAELGGSLRVRGPVNAVRPVGSFELIRGRLVILGQRIVFTEGSIVLLGDLDPVIRFVAETRTDTVTVRVIIDGPVQDPSIEFQSTPELPQDEVLAQLLFGRSMSDLSAFQLAQLAAAVAELAGSGGGPGLLEQIRIFAGLDNLEVITTEDGGTAAEAGRYIADNIYVGVRAGDQSSGVTVNLDVTRELKVRAEALTDETSIGVYFEHEY